MSAPPKNERERPRYPAWIRVRRTLALWLVAGGLLIAGVVVARWWLPGLVLGLLALPLLDIAIVLSAAMHRLGPGG
ncbi:MAG: hypothetical protein H6712_18795 [Myxococcales bacterium]|nr:hypothetical protein [Myxococcales bacterium]MCB9715923.1 hypothetical protein [Myxococcales bacterium]